MQRVGSLMEPKRSETEVDANWTLASCVLLDRRLLRWLLSSAIELWLVAVRQRGSCSRLYLFWSVRPLARSLALSFMVAKEIESAAMC